MESETNCVLDEEIFWTSSDQDTPIQPDAHFFSFRTTQIRSGSLGTPQNFPCAPHPSPVLSPDPNVASRLSDIFESELLKACNTFCDRAKLIRGTVSSSTSPEKLSEPTPKKPDCTSTTNPLDILEPVSSSSSPNEREFSSRVTFCDDSNSSDASECMAALLPSNRPQKERLKTISRELECMPRFYVNSNPLDIEDILESVSSPSSPVKRQLEDSSVESDTENYSRKFLLQCRSPMRLASSVSNISLHSCPSSPFSANSSVVVHCGSDISDFSATESEIYSEYTLNPVNQNAGGSECDFNDSEVCEENSAKSSAKENYDRVTMDFPVNVWKVFSPRKPRSSVGEFLNWRKNKALRRKKGTSLENVYTPPPIRRMREDRDSKFLMTV